MVTRMKIERLVFFGTAPIAVPTLAALWADAGSRVVAVCTQPDRPSGRKRKPTPSPVKVEAKRLGLPVLDPEHIRDAREELAALQPDLGVVFAYGQYMPSTIFEAPRLGSVNFHPSLLPEYRGASPIQSAIADGKTETGLSVIRVGREMDAGDILLQERVAIREEDTGASLHDRFADLAASWVPEVLARFREERVEWTPQDPDRVTECARLCKADGAVDWTLPARVLWNRLRAYQPWPGLFFEAGGGVKIKIHGARVEAKSGLPGELLETSGEGPLVACGQDALRLTRLQPPGKTPMSGDAFLNGHPLEPGTRFPGGRESA